MLNCFIIVNTYFKATFYQDKRGINNALVSVPYLNKQSLAGYLQIFQDSQRSQSSFRIPVLAKTKC